MAVQNELIPKHFLADGIEASKKANTVGEMKKLLDALPDDLPLGKTYQGGINPYKIVVYNNSDAAATEPYASFEDASYD